MARPGRLLLILTILATIASPLIAHAASASNKYVQGPIYSSVYKAGTTVTIRGVVNGSIYCAGQNVTIDAEVKGDIYCIGQTLNVSGNVTGSLHLVGQSITNSSKVSQTVTIIGQDITSEKNSLSSKDANYVGQNVTIDGNIGRDLSAVASNLTLNNHIGRDANLKVASLNLNSSAAIDRNLTYYSPNTLNKQNGATIHGQIFYHKGQARGPNVGYFVIGGAIWVAAFTVFGVVLVAIFPQLFRKWNPTKGSAAWGGLLIGFLASFIVPAIIIALSITVIGFPLAILLLLLWVIEAMLTMPIASYFLGSYIIPRRHPVLAVLIGGIILGLLILIPIVGWIIALLAYWIGSGLFIKGIRGSLTRPSYLAD